MIRHSFFYLFLLLVIATGSYAQSRTDAPSLADREAAVNSAVTDLYAAYSFEEGNYPANEDILAHFTEDAMLSYVTGEGLVTLPVAEFFEQWQEANRANGTTFLQEVEQRGRTEVFNAIAHRISSVAFTARGEENSTGRAIISLQLVREEGTWRVHTMLWESVGEGTTLPERFRAEN